MRKIFFISAALICLTLMGIACSKLIEESNQPTGAGADKLSSSRDGSYNDFALTTGDVSYSNGLLVFKDKATFESVITSVDDMDANADFKANFLSTKGASALDSDSPDYVEAPGCQAFEERFSGFGSQRMRVQNGERLFLESGGEPGNFDGGFIKNQAVQTMFNQNHEIKIGDVILKFIDEHHVLAVLDGDFATLNNIRGWTDYFRTDLPGNVVRLDDRLEEDQQILIGILDFTCYSFISAPIYGNDNFKLEAYSYLAGHLETGLSYSWQIWNAAGVLIWTGTGSPAITGTLSNVIYPLKIKVTGTGGPCDEPTVAYRFIYTGTPACDFTPSFGESPYNLGELNFYIGSQPGNSGNTFSWEIKEENGTPVTLNGPNVDYDAGDGEYKILVKVTMTNPFGEGCSTTKIFVVERKCGTTTDKKVTSFYAGNTRKAVGEIIVDNFGLLYHSFNSKITNYRKKSNGNWTKEKADQMNFVYSVNSKFIKNCNTSQSCDQNPYCLNSDKLQYKYQYGSGTKITIRETELTCTYSVVEDGVSYPDLIVINY